MQTTVLEPVGVFTYFFFANRQKFRKIYCLWKKKQAKSDLAKFFSCPANVKPQDSYFAGSEAKNLLVSKKLKRQSHNL
jgi:hypothetical protein